MKATNKNVRWMRLCAFLLSMAMLIGLLAGCSAQEPETTRPQEQTAQTPPEDPQEYLEYVSENGVRRLLGNGSFGELFSGKGISTQTKLTLGQQLLDALSDEAGVDLSFVKSLSWKMQVGMEDAKTKETLSIELNDSPLLTLDALLDQTDNVLYFAVPELSGQYLKIALQDEASLMTDVPLAYDQLGALIQALPAQEELAQLLNKYMDLFVEQLKNVERTTQTVTVDGVSQQLTVLSVTVSEQEACNGICAILESAGTDPQLRQILEQLDAAMGSEDTQSLYTAFTQGVEELLAELQELQPESTEKLIIRLYTDENHQLSGLDMSLEDQQLMSWLSVLSADAYRLNAQLDTLQITGTGTKTDRQFKIIADGEEQLTLELRNYDPEKNQNGSCSLELVLKPGQAALEEMEEETAAMLEQLGGEPAIGLVLEADGQSCRLVVDILVGEQSLMAMDMTVRPEAVDVTVPQNAVDMNSEEELVNWLGSVNVDVLLNNLTAAGIPQELLMELMSAAMGAF